MKIVSIILSVVLLGVIIYFLVSAKSSRVLRMAAIIALSLIALSLAVCGFFVIKGPSNNTSDIPLPFLLEEAPPPAKKANIPAIIFFSVAFFAILGLIAHAAVKEMKGRGDKDKVAVKSKSSAPPILPQTDELKLDDAGAEDGFDLGLD